MDTTDEMDEFLPSPDACPRLRRGVNLIEPPANYQEIVRRLRQGIPLQDLANHPVKLAILRIPDGTAEVRQLSSLSAKLLALCAGNLTS